MRLDDLACGQLAGADPGGEFAGGEPDELGGFGHLLRAKVFRDSAGSVGSVGFRTHTTLSARTASGRRETGRGG
ncbi:hypothetical protein GCM10009837_06120 [Streptomyces durmitorensis]